MKKSIIIYLLSITAILTSCQKNILDKKPLDIISDDEVWSDPSLIKSYLTQCYAETYVFDNVVEPNSPTYIWEGDEGVGPMYLNEVSDEAKAGYMLQGYNFKLGNLKISGGFEEWWEDAYLVIRQLNELITRLPQSPVDSSIKVELTAEARFLRAYNYFEMVKRYGGVPIITVAQDPDDDKSTLYPKRNKEQEVYDFILSECDTIFKELPATTTDLSRPSKYAALALKCRAALYAGSIAQFGTVQLDGIVGIDGSKSQSYYQQAYNAADTIINSGYYQLYNKYPDDKVKNFRQKYLDEGNSESIFVKRHDGTNGVYGAGNGWAYDFFQCPLPDGWGTGNQDAPYLEMAEEFEHIDGRPGTLDRTAIQQGLWTTDQLWANKDPRFFATLYTENTEWQGTNLDYHRGIITADGTIQTDGSYKGVLANGNQNVVNGTGFGVLKYLDENHGNLIGSNGDWATSSTDYIVFGYAEVLLNYAEAAFELNKSDDALGAVNQIRSRAGIALLTSIDRDKIRHERKVELAFEGHRYWDTRRWRIATTVLSVNNSGLRYILDYNTGKFKLMVIDNIDGTVQPPKFFDYNYYFPITLARTGNNPNLVENPGYH